MPKLLYVSTVAATLRRFIAPYGQYFRQLGWQVDAAAAGVEDDPICCNSFSDVYHLPMSRRASDLGNVTKARKALKYRLKQGNYDLIHVHTPIASWICRWVARRRPSNQKLIYTAHGFHFHHRSSGLRNQVFQMLEKKASRWMDHLVVINEQDYQNALRLGIANQNNMTLMRGIGVNLAEFSLQGSEGLREQTRGELGFSEADRVLLMIAGFTPNKRHIDAIRALAQLPQPHPFQLVFVGGGGERIQQKLKQATSDLGVSERTHFLGFRDDIRELLAAADVQLLLSQREGLPRSIMEGLAMNRKIIGTKIRGTTDLLKEGVGILIEPQRPEMLAKAILESEHFEVNQTQRQARLEECRLDQILQQHQQLYSSMLGRKPVSVERITDEVS